MRAAITALTATAAMINNAFAAHTPAAPAAPLTWCLISFCAAVVVGQTIPALLALCGNGRRTTPRTANHK